jgi:hypothetical protein
MKMWPRHLPWKMAPSDGSSRDVPVISAKHLQNTNSEVDARRKFEKHTLSSINGRLNVQSVLEMSYRVIAVSHVRVEGLSQNICPDRNHRRTGKLVLKPFTPRQRDNIEVQSPAPLVAKDLLSGSNVHIKRP